MDDFDPMAFWEDFCGFQRGAMSEVGQKRIRALFAEAHERGLAEGEKKGMLRAAEICMVKVEYAMPIPCPDGISGCCVAHFINAKRMPTGDECAQAIEKEANK